MAKGGLRIRKVEPGSLGAQVGLAAGDEILAVNRHPVADELALRFHLAEECVRLDVKSPGQPPRQINLDLSEGGHLGIDVEDFETRTCSNSCLFCFVDQLPPGVRPGLRMRDDDYRLSFLHGNYITLTNLPERELDRIIEQALSPLYVSVHATDAALRTRILGRKKVDNLDFKLRKLIRGGIRIHAQVVLMPEVNDGDHLRKTVFDLYSLYPGVSSVAIVPLGLSDHGAARGKFKPVAGPFCREVIRQTAPWREQFLREVNRGFAYLGDEFYIQGGVDIPESSYYDDFAQIEDGVGMVRRFLDDLDQELAGPPGIRRGLHGTLVTGTLFGPTLARAAAALNRKFSSHLKVLAVENGFLGRGITVAGLLSGRDILAALRDADVGEFALLPDDAISRADGLFLDDLTLDDLAQRIRLPLFSCGRTVRDFLALLSRL